MFDMAFIIAVPLMAVLIIIDNVRNGARYIKNTQKYLAGSLDKDANIFKTVEEARDDFEDCPRGC
jgi:hypothetical protein